MGAFLRFTLLVGALVAAAAVGYAVGLSRSERFALSDERMTIDTGRSPEPVQTRSDTPDAADRPGSAAAAAAPVEAQVRPDPDAPTSIDDILQRQVAPTPAAE